MPDLPIIARLRELSEKATKPWSVGCLGSDSRCQCPYVFDDWHAGAVAAVHVGNGLLVGKGGNDAPEREQAIAHMHLIAEARNALPALLDAVEALEALVDACEAINYVQQRQVVDAHAQASALAALAALAKVQP